LQPVGFIQLQNRCLADRRAGKQQGALRGVAQHYVFLFGQLAQVAAAVLPLFGGAAAKGYGGIGLHGRIYHQFQVKFFANALRYLLQA